MNADLHNLDVDPDQPADPWEFDHDSSDYPDGLDDLDELALEIAENELDQIDRWIDVANRYDPPVLSDL